MIISIVLQVRKREPVSDLLVTKEGEEEGERQQERAEQDMMEGRGELTPQQIAQLMSIIADMDSVKGLRQDSGAVAANSGGGGRRTPPTDAELEEFISYMERGGARLQVGTIGLISHTCMYTDRFPDGC
jgi:hypothetical protein